MKADQDYLVNWLCIKEGTIPIKECKMARDPTTKILWIEVGEGNVNKIFQKAAYYKNPKVRLHRFFPHCVWERKNSLQSNLNSYLQANPKSFKYMIKPSMYNVALHIKSKGEAS